jgi:hypothetical protein
VNAITPPKIEAEIVVYKVVMLGWKYWHVGCAFETNVGELQVKNAWCLRIVLVDSYLRTKLRN